MRRTVWGFTTLACLATISAAPAQPGPPAGTVTRPASPVSLPYEKVLPGRMADYEIMTASGAWGKEYLLSTRRLSDAGFRFVENKGRSAATLKPWLMLRNLRTGQGVAVLLAYSGNWKMEVQPRNGKTVLRVDTSPSALPPFTEVGGLPIPGALVVEFRGDWDDGARPIARFIRDRLRRNLGPDWPPVQYNTWYDVYDNINEARLLETVRVAAELGCELFTIDAGWFGSGERWSRALGQWDVNRHRLPGGLQTIAAEARRRGMKFGLWIEIECAAPTAPVVRDHPDWVLMHNGQPLSRRTALDFGHPQARAWAKSALDRLVTTYALDYIKMDFNTNLPVDGESLTPETDPLYRHYRGLVELWRHLRTTYPDLIVENCSSGSLRQDAMTAAFTDTHWVSDNVDNTANLAMNFGATFLFPPEICSHWTTAPAETDGPLDRESSFTANMLGHILGLSGPSSPGTPRRASWLRERIARYKEPAR
ncbi:alpha-galactosidase [bacterium]|nr:alpha-galactosidase [bacterium]